MGAVAPVGGNDPYRCQPPRGWKAAGVIFLAQSTSERKRLRGSAALWDPLADKAALMNFRCSASVISFRAAGRD